MSKVAQGSKVKVHYAGTFSDGSEFDNSRTRGEAMEFEVGGTDLITGFSNAVVGMEAGETKTVTIEPDDAYGDVIKEAFQTTTKDNFPEDFKFELGQIITGQSGQGVPFIARIHEVTDSDVTLDLNHPLAGKDLTFEIEILEIEE